MPFPNIFIPKYILIADATFMHDALPLTDAGRVPTEQIPGWRFASSIHDWPSGRLLGVLRALQALQRIQAHRYATNSSHHMTNQTSYGDLISRAPDQRAPY